MRRHHGRALSPFAGRTASPPSAEATLVRSFDSRSNPSRPVRQSPLATSQFQGMPLDLIDRIRSFPLFQSTPAGFLTDIGLLLKPQLQSPHDYIITEGDDAKAMYWLVRGGVAVTSRDGESTYAELKPGAFFGEIGILMDRPRTATVIARTRCLLLVLKKEDLETILPKYPDVDRAIREEALERLAQLEKKKNQVMPTEVCPPPARRPSKRAREPSSDGFIEGEIGLSINGTSKRRKSPSPGMNEVSTASALGHGLVNIRATLKELPLFTSLPQEMLHFLGLNAQPVNFTPFTDIIKQNTVGRQVYFLVRGEVEVLDESPQRRTSVTLNGAPKPPQILARLRPGQYFGEVVSLDLADRRTATVRSVTQVECLMISENVLAEFWERCPSDVKRQIEQTAKERLHAAFENDVVMKDTDSTPDINDLAIGDSIQPADQTFTPPSSQRVTFQETEVTNSQDEPSRLEPLDPDPYSSASLDKVRQRSRRGSLAPIPPDEPGKEQHRLRSSRSSPSNSPSSSSSPRTSRPNTPSPTTDPRNPALNFFDPWAAKSVKPRSRRSLGHNGGKLPDKLLNYVFRYLDLHDLMKLQAVSQHWQHLVTRSPLLLKDLDLSQYNRKVTDDALINRICPFVGSRPRTIDISNCFHITDEGFKALAMMCGANVTVWRMKSVWDVTAPAILEMSTHAKGLREVDLSNCRKVSDTLLARIVGWVVPGQPPGLYGMNNRHKMVNGQRPIISTRFSSNASTSSTTPNAPPGTVLGCPQLSTITLSYCKHITDRSMHHIASHAANRIECVDLTRCTTITDTGFQYWGNVRFERLRKLCLADCTYLSDQSIVWLVNGAGSKLRELDLSFCCALSDTATEVLALGCPNLTHLNLSFCGSAVSDPSLRSIGLHLTALRQLAVRGCVRVTGIGVEGILEGCQKLQVFDVSQCKNLQPWLDSGGVERWRHRHVHFEVVSSGSKLVR